MKEFKAGVETRSNGRIKVEIYPANQLGQLPATVEGVAFGHDRGDLASQRIFRRLRTAVPGL